MLRKIKKLWAVLKYYFEDEDNLLLHLIEMKAYESLETCADLEVSMTEELEDLIFHIKTYYDIPESLLATSYSHLSEKDIKGVIEKYKKGKLSLEEVSDFADYLVEVEEQRAVERDLIFEHAKILSFGFKL